MKNEQKKITLIVNELLTLLLHHGASDINIQITKKDHYISVNFIQKDCDFDTDLVDKLKFELKAQRQNEVEGYYWQLVGKASRGDELHLVGAMIDESTITLEDNVLTIYLKRVCLD